MLYGALLATALGVIVGALAGIYGGWLDVVLMRLADMLSFFPALLLILFASRYIHPVTVLDATLILSVFLWIPVARVIRSQFLSLGNTEFVEASRSLGATDRHILFRHLLPNASGAIIIAGTALLGQLILLEALVDYFIGASASELTLGGLISQGQQFVITLGWSWWTWASPAMFLVVIVLCINLLGDGLVEALRPTP
jgi:peptide/nickel transport system permease protein